MAAAVHHHHHLLLRLLPPPPRGLRIFFFFSPRPPPLTRLRSSLPALAVTEWEGREDDQFVVVTFYKLVPVEDPGAEVATHLHFLQGRDIHGRIYMNEQGINAQLEGDSSHLPLVEPSMRASPLTPSEQRERLGARKFLDVSPNQAAGDISGRKLLLLDVRNDYEWDIGHFEGAKRPNVDCFRSTSFALSEQEYD